MSVVARPRRRLTSSKDLINIMDVKTAKKPPTTFVVEGKRIELTRSLSQGHGKRVLRYFTLESMFLLFCLTASLLILPLILPPLPPPPFMLLLLPICILAVLMMLAFMPSNVRDVTYTYV